VRILPPNNGMHPTADTTAFMLIKGLGRAGDAGRYVALLMRAPEPGTWNRV
jgi:hypothetical protein